MKYLEQRPCVEQIERADNTAPTWVATVADERLCDHDQIRDAVKRVLHKEIGNAKNPLRYFLMVSGPIGTQFFATWTRGIQNNVAKIFVKKVFEPFGDEAAKKAWCNTHVMNTRHAQQIKKWILKCELEEDQDQAALLQIEEDFTDEKMKAKFLEIVRQQISDRKACEEQRALCDAIGGMMFEPAPDSSSPLTEDHLKQCVVELFNCGESKLFSVNNKIESEREGAVRDSLPIGIGQKLSALDRLEREGQDTEEVKRDILETLVKTSFDMAQDNLLPTLDDRNAKGPFVKRAQNVTKHLTGEEPDKKAVEGTLAKLQARDGFKCSQCQKKLKQGPDYYRVKETGICYPISALDTETAKNDSILVFCSYRCEEKWDETLMCPKCKTFEWKRDVEGIAPYPCPFQILDNFAQYDYCRRYIPGYPVCPITRNETKMIVLPLCTTCDYTMMPRTPQAPHLTLCFSHDDMPMKPP